MHRGQDIKEANKCKITSKVFTLYIRW